MVDSTGKWWGYAGPSATIFATIENVAIVFEDGVCYDSANLMQSVRGIAGRQ